MGVVVSDRGDAVEMVVTGAWTAAAAAAAGSGEVDRLVLNHALGFNEPSLDFVEGLPLRELVILDPRLDDLAPVHSLGQTLRALRVTTSPALRLDLTQLPHLQSLGASWRQVSETIGAAKGVQSVFLRSYEPPDLVPLAAMVDLAELVLKDRPRLRSLAGLSAFSRLRLLGVYLAKDLVDIDDLAECPGIEELGLEACREIANIEVLSRCTRLRKLNVSDGGDLASLSPIRTLASLEQISLFGSTKIADNDLSPLRDLPHLRQLRMQSRRSYRPSVEEIQAQLPRN